MDENTLFAIRNLFYAGNYTQVITEASSPRTRASANHPTLHQLDLFLFKSLIATKNYTRVAQEISSESRLGLQALKAQAVYLDAVQSSDSAGRDAAMSHLRELLQVHSEEDPEPEITALEVKVVVGQVLASEGLVEEALSVLLPHNNHLESAAVVVQIYLQMNRVDLAKKEVEACKSWAEDAMLAQLMEAWVGLRVGGGDRYQNAYYIYEEIATSSTQPTVKSLVGEAVCNIQMGQYPEAEGILQEALAREPSNTDAIVNQIVLSTLTSKPTEEINVLVQQLQSVAPNHSYLQDLDLKSSLFDRAAQRFAIA
ncbi:coatomer subunit epsilon [Entomortierella parvispora]|uniref:Coatomer subunit epsilon n=1 Tax=Entomortierella parvispora TaxID=205924 RepID=A0A9P3LUA7_9FUNG|nr:coatomer subunit epsilon [Entomortierella parvispora]